MFLAQGNWLQRLFAPLERFFASLEQAIAPSEGLSTFLGNIDAWIWGLFLVFILVGTGLFFAWRTGFIQLRKLAPRHRPGARQVRRPGGRGRHQPLPGPGHGAVSATIGTGNIAGVATAIARGGPGAVFWMWVTGLLGSGIKFASCTLGMKYRVFDADGNASGGPMYYLEHGLGRRWLGSLIKLAVFVASFFLAGR